MLCGRQHTAQSLLTRLSGQLSLSRWHTRICCASQTTPSHCNIIHIRHSGQADASMARKPAVDGTRRQRVLVNSDAAASGEPEDPIQAAIAAKKAQQGISSPQVAVHYSACCSGVVSAILAWLDAASRLLLWMKQSYYLRTRLPVCLDCGGERACQTCLSPQHDLAVYADKTVCNCHRWLELFSLSALAAV